MLTPRARVGARGAHHDAVPLLLTDRACLGSPLALIRHDDARRLGLRLSPPRFRRLRSGVWVDAEAYAALPPWLQYATRVHAFLTAHPDAILCRESAAVIHGLPLFGHPPLVHVYAPERRSSRTFGDVQWHASDDPRDVVDRSGVSVTAVADTVIDLGRVLAPAHALAMVDAALSPAQGGILMLGDLEDTAGSQVNRRGSARLRWLIEHADARSESPGESVSRAVIHWLGFATPRLQVELWHEGRQDRVDFLFDAERVVGESDGWAKYELDDRPLSRQRLRDEKRREDRIRRAGFTVARWDMNDAASVAPLRSILLSAGLRRVAPEQHAKLATLRPSAPRASR